jgi:hypothetical protein
MVRRPCSGGSTPAERRLPIVRFELPVAKNIYISAKTYETDNEN